jgi:phospholipid/cholesterol/gamma-HCH transport system substrate-binding protein
MERKTNTSLKLGIFIIAGVVLFVTAIYRIGKQRQLFGTSFRINCIFYNVGGLQVGNNVRFSGINVGIVDNIQLIRDTSVLVTMVIDSDVMKYIKDDSKAIIGSEGLMGDKIVTISPGSSSGKPVKDDGYIMAIKPVEVDQILGKLKETADNAALITGDLADIIGNIHAGRGTVGALLMDTTFERNVKQTVKNVQQGASGFSDNMEAAKNSFLLRGFFKKKKKQEKK